MGLTVCPAAVVAAPVEVIWGNLVHWERYCEWFDRSVQVEWCEPDARPRQVRPSPSLEKPWAAPGTLSSRSKRSIPKDTGSACMLFSPWACK